MSNPKILPVPYTDKILRIRVTPTEFSAQADSEMVVLRPSGQSLAEGVTLEQGAKSELRFSVAGNTFLRVPRCTFEPVDVVQTEMDPESLVCRATVDGERVEARISRQTVIRRDWKARVHVGECQGSFPGMVRERVFHVANMAGAGFENWLAANGN